MGMGNLQRMAMQMQQQMMRVQQELTEARLESSAGGGAVKVTVTGKKEVVSITIDPAAVDPDDVEMLQDMVVAAVNDALHAAEELEKSKMAAITGGMSIPGMF